MSNKHHQHPMQDWPRPGYMPTACIPPRVAVRHSPPIPTTFALQNLHHNGKPLHLAAPDHHSSAISHNSTPQWFSQIQDTLNTLSKSPPFRVRFSEDHSLIGRVIAFDALCRGLHFELKVFIEYPIGSQTVFQSASGAVYKMHGDSWEKLGSSGYRRDFNGYEDLEFERINGEDDWRILGELLAEEVRSFRGSAKKDLLPTPFLDPKFPNMPQATLNATRGFLKNNPLNSRKQTSSDENMEGSESRKDRRIENGDDSRGSHSPKSPMSPSSIQGSSNGHSAHSPCNDKSTPTSLPGISCSVSSLPNGDTHNPKSHSPSSPPTSVKQCLLCQKTLEDTRFVQCPSTPPHKFCFGCSRDSIKKQSESSSDVYCPSGMKCVWSTTWAFTEQEISTIFC